MVPSWLKKKGEELLSKLGKPILAAIVKEMGRINLYSSNIEKVKIKHIE